MTDDHLEATVSLRGVVFVDGDVLLVKRATDRGWELPGGRLAPTEDVTDGVRREIREETDLGVEVERPVHTVSWRNDADRGRFAVYFHCRGAGRDVTLSDEHVEYAWRRPATATEQLSVPQGTAVERATRSRRRLRGAEPRPPGSPSEASESPSGSPPGSPERE